MHLKQKSPATLLLEDGSIFKGSSIGADGISVGEVVFNTSMTGYQEILSDPSYARQIVTLTYPHIGNVGTNNEDQERDKSWCAGLVIKDLPRLCSNFRSEQTLSDYLKNNNLVAIADIDTRRLTRLLRNKGALRGCLMSGEFEVAKAEQALSEFAGLKGMDLAKDVTSESVWEWGEGVWQLPPAKDDPATPRFHVVAYDFGVKHNILRILVQKGCRVTVVPAQTSAQQVMDLKPDGVFLSNGPGDPEPCDYAIEAIKTFLEADMPLFGICLGHQLLSLAAGAKTLKMKFGHHGANHPVLDIAAGTVHITSQNHGFAVDPDSLPDQLQITHRSLFDQSLQGVEHKTKPAFSFQGHPEASPGPHDILGLFDRFIALMEAA